MSDDTTKTTPRQTAMIAALLAGKTVEAAADSIEISHRTAWRWMREPAFQAELAAARREILTSALDVLTAGARVAAGEVLRLATSNIASPSVRLRAAEAILDRLHKWAELEDLAARITALEERHAAEN